jgi:hemolysin D
MSAMAQSLKGHWAVVRHALDEEKRHATGLVRTSETAFLPAALEIVERPVSPTARATTWVLLALLVLTALWLTFGKVDVVASAQGKLIPADNVKLVQPAEAGIVRAIYVRDGTKVRRGQPLIALDPTVSGAEAEQAKQALEAAELDAARARAVLSALDGQGLRFVAPPGTPADVAQTQAQLARAELAGIEASTLGGNADTRVASAARAEAQVQAAKLTETLPLLDEQIAANEALLAKGYVSKLRVIEMRRQRLSAARDRDMALETIRKASAQMASAGSGASQTRAEARARILTNLAKAESEATVRREELVKSAQRSTLQQLLSPVDGSVAQLAVHTIGGVVEPAKPVMIIVPQGSNLVVEARLLNRDVGFVRVGQSVAVKLEAFPFTRHGTIEGRIESIGSDAVNDEKLGPVFPVRIRLLCGNAGKALCSQITPGMAATADVRTGRRSILSYLMSPIDEARLEAGRER